MGLISLITNVVSTARDAVVSEVQDQYIEVFKCDSLGQDVLVRRGATRIVKGNNKGDTEVISNGSIILVPEGTALLLVDNGEVIDFTTKAGRYQWDSTTAPSLLGDSHFLTNAKKVVADAWERMRAGGELTKQQRVYFVNLREIRDQNFGTPKPIPYADPEYRNIYISMNGKFSFRIEDPVAFFKKVSSNIAGEYKVLDLMGKPADMLQPRMEFLDHLTEVVNRCGGVDKIMFANLPTEKTRLRNYMRDALDEDWLQARGIVVDEVAIAVITPDDKSRERIEQVDQSKMFGADPNALAAAAVLGQTEALNTAAGNSAGAATGLMGMGLVGGVGQMGATNAAFNYMGQQQ
ncbi:MAG: SPFH domain-containing protein, partial [Clostridiales bacterium]|nr:SPFH domain-containing protein [Clostridiales bacterium]